MLYDDYEKISYVIKMKNKGDYINIKTTDTLLPKIGVISNYNVI